MKFFAKYPLRITIPLFLLVAGTIISVYSMIYGLRLSDAEAEKSGMMFVIQDMSQLQGNVDHYLREGNVEGIKVVIADRGSNPNIELALLADENNVVLRATSLKLPGLPIQQAVPDIDADLINHARKTMSGRAFLSKKRDSISAYYPVVIGARQQELRPSLIGILFMKYDLTYLKAAHRYALEQQMWQSVSFYSLLFLSLGILLYYALTKRVLRLVAATKRFAAGDVSAHSGLQGKDEIAQLGEAFDSMVEKIIKEQEAFHKSEADLREAQRLAHIGSWDWDITTDTIIWSEEYYRIYGIAPKLPTPNYTEHLKAYTPESRERLDAAVKKAMEDGSPYELDLELAKLSTTTRWISARGEVRRDSDGKIVGFRGTAQNITERKEAEGEIRKLNEELEQRVIRRTADLQQKSSELQESQMALMNIVDDLNNKTEELEDANIKLRDLDRLKSMFIASMSHELRTPLNSIIGFSSILHDGWIGPVNAEQKENLATILRSGKHLLNLINDVIDVSKIESGKIEITCEDFDVYDVVSEAVGLFKKDIQEKGLELKVEPIHLDMHTDRRRLLQCLVNLINNAVKFTVKGSVRVSVRSVRSSESGGGSNVKVSELRTQNSELHGDFVEISVEDTGIGIKEEDISKLFGAFVRLQSPMSTSVKGTGLGLYLTKKIVTEILGGEISAESVYGKGSRFVIRIPVQCEKGAENEESTGNRRQS